MRERDERFLHQLSVAEFREMMRREMSECDMHADHGKGNFKGRECERDFVQSNTHVT